MAVGELESVATQLRAWAEEHSTQIQEGILELSDSFPQVTVVGFGPADLALFVTLAGLLQATVLVLNAHPLTEDDLRLAKALAEDRPDPAERTHFKKIVTAARGHLGKVHELEAIAVAPGLDRAVVFRIATDWGAELFSLAAGLMDDPE